MSQKQARSDEARTADAIAWRLRGYKVERTAYAMPGRTAARDLTVNDIENMLNGHATRETLSRPPVPWNIRMGGSGTCTDGDDTLHRVEVVVGDESHTSIDVLGVSVVDGRRQSMLLRLRHAEVDLDVRVAITDTRKWYPLLGFINPRHGGIEAVERALEGIRPILKGLAG